MAESSSSKNSDGNEYADPLGRSRNRRIGNAVWDNRPVIRIDPRYFRPTEVETLLGDPTKAKRKLAVSRSRLIPQNVINDDEQHD